MSDAQRLVLQGIRKAADEGDTEGVLFLRKLWKVDGSGNFGSDIATAIPDQQLEPDIDDGQTADDDHAQALQQ